MDVQCVTLFVDGMTCPSCVARVSKCLLSLEGVSRSDVRLQGGKASVEYDGSLVDIAAMKAAIEKAGYAVRERKGAATPVAVGIGLLLSAAYLLASAGGLFNAIPRVDASIGYAMLFVIGLLTSIHCVAMCGGIALSQSIRAKSDPAAETRGKFDQLSPGLLYNAGRVLSYTLLGGLVGAAGAAFSFSSAAKGSIAAAAGLFMVFLGLRMLGVMKDLPRLPGFLRRLPGSALGGAWAKAGAAIRKRGSFAVGFLNGLMPCGPLQTMQLYALGTGSALAGAFSMFLFSLGTVPLMLLFGASAAFIPRKFVPSMLKASAVLVMFLGVVTFTRAAALAGIPLPELPALSRSSSASGTGTALAAGASGTGTALATLAGSGGQAGAGGIRAVLAGGRQTVLTEFTGSDYVPFTVQAGVPVRWTIRVKAGDLNGCNNPVEVPAYGIRKVLVPGDNLIEFTPSREGTISYSCWMGMISSRIRVVADLAAAPAAPPPDGGNLSDLLVPDSAGSAGSGGNAGTGGCCSGSGNPDFDGGRIPVDSIGMPTIKDGVQVITIEVTSQGYSPAAIVLQKGMDVVIKFKPVELTSCNSPVVFPQYNGSLDLSQGLLETPPLAVSTDFTFRCWMGMLNGYVKVVDDLTKVDFEKVKAEIGAYRAPTGGGCGGAS